MDYVGVQSDEPGCAVSTATFEDSFLAIGAHVDHRCVSVVLRAPLLSVAAGAGARRAWFKRDALRLPEVQELMRRPCSQVLHFPADVLWGSNRLELLCSKLCRVILSEVAPPERPAPRSEWMSASTWALATEQRSRRRQFS